MDDLIERAQARAIEMCDVHAANEKAIQLELLAAILVELRKLNEPKGLRQRLMSLFGR